MEGIWRRSRGTDSSPRRLVDRDVASVQQPGNLSDPEGYDALRFSRLKELAEQWKMGNVKDDAAICNRYHLQSRTPQATTKKVNHHFLPPILFAKD